MSTTELTEAIARKAEAILSDVGPCECGSNDWHTDEHTGVVNGKVTVFCDDCGGTEVSIPLDRIEGVRV